MVKIATPVGKRYGKLIVEGDAPSHISPGGQLSRKVRCVCDCGKVVETRLGSLKNGTAKSCGCWRFQATRKHGMSRTDIYSIWRGMVSRATGKRMRERYFDRGIRVDDRWLIFENFRDDMGERPEGTSIERIDNSKGYCKENCKWATPFEQARNRRTNRMLRYEGRLICLTDLAISKGVPPCRLTERLKRGIPLEKALSTPVKSSVRMIRYKGESLPLTKMAEKYGISRGALADRLSKGWTVHKALTRPLKKDWRRTR
jgi:hypothetical protein